MPTGDGGGGQIGTLRAGTLPAVGLFRRALL